VRWGRGWDGGDAPPYWPWRQALRDLPAHDGADRFAYFSLVTDMLRSESEKQPLMLVLDDLQAADEDSLRLLEFVASEVAEMPMLIVAVARDGAPRLEELARVATRTVQLGS
jgi:predicted ATPase